MLATTRTRDRRRDPRARRQQARLHLALSLERLTRCRGGRLLRIGLSATQKPIEEVARFLVGAGSEGAPGGADCTIVDTGHRRARDLALELPLSAARGGDVGRGLGSRSTTGWPS